MSERPKEKMLLRAKSLVEPDVQNPFSYRLQLTACDKLKVSFTYFNNFISTLFSYYISERS